MYNRDTKVIGIMALIVAILGLTVGFAAFANNLDVKSSADVIPGEENFIVNFSSSNIEEKFDNIIGVPSSDEVLVKNATINNDGNPTIEGLHATFTKPGQYATYSFYVHNGGYYDAYLKSVTYENIAGTNELKKCIPTSEVNSELLTEACKAINVEIKVGNETYTGPNGTVIDHKLSKNEYEPVVVTIKYDENGGLADGSFEVLFGDLSLTYGTTK